MEFERCMPLQINIWLLLAGAFQGLLLSLVLFRKKTYRQGYGFLLLYLLVLIAQIFFKVADKYWLMEGMRNAYTLSYKFPLLYGPLVLLFVRHVTSPQERWQPKDFLHFLPFVYSLVVVCFRDWLDADNWLRWPLKSIPSLVSQIASLLVYHLLALRLWQRHQKDLHERFSELHRFRLQWVHGFIVWSFGVCLCIALLSFFIYTLYPAHNWLRFGFLLLCVFVYWISYWALQRPQLFSDAKIFAFTPSLFESQLTAVKPSKKYANSGLADEEAARIAEALRNLMAEKKLYTDPLLSIDQLAAELQVNRHILSQVLNDRLSQSFYGYVNGLRVEAAKELLADPDFAQQKIAAIGYEAGFNSLSAFNDVFKKMTGQTPSGFRKQLTEASRKQRV
jgi:AraC-like DNA-binding protein